MQELQETQVQCLGQEDPLEEGIATHASVLAWRIPWTELPGQLQRLGLPKVGYKSSHLACLYIKYSFFHLPSHTSTATSELVKSIF